MPDHPPHDPKRIREHDQARHAQSKRRKDIAEPSFRHGPGGRREMVHPGNEEYIRGDRIARPQGGGGKAKPVARQAASTTT